MYMHWSTYFIFHINALLFGIPVWKCYSAIDTLIYETPCGNTYVIQISCYVDLEIVFTALKNVLNLIYSS
jgi:hypothetical protein